MACARIDDDAGPLGRIDNHAGRRRDAKQSVVDRTIDRARIENYLVVEVRHGLEALGGILDEVVTSLPKRLPEENGALCRIHGIAVPVPRIRRRRQRRKRVDTFSGGGPIHALRKLLVRYLHAFVETLGDLCASAVAARKLNSSVHGENLWEPLSELLFPSTMRTERLLRSLERIARLNLY